MELAILFLTISVLSVLMFLIVRVRFGGIYGLLTKTFASFCFVLFGIFSFLEAGFHFASLLVVAGLACGMIGDILLDLKVVYKEHNKIYLNSGMIAFGIGHVFYFVALLQFATPLSNLTLPLIVAAGGGLLLTPIIYFVSKKMGLNYGDFKWQTIAYCFILAFMTIFSIYTAVLQPVFYSFAVGITLIFLSDLVLSMQYFGGKEKSPLFVILNHTLYYLGQISIAMFLFTL